MLKLRLLLLHVTITISTGQDDVLTEVYRDMGIIPSYMDTPPEGHIKIVYDQNVVIENGIEIKPIQMKEPPTVEWTAAVGNYYSIMMICPDAPSRSNPYLRDWIHWLVVNIPGADLEQGEVICPHTTLLAPKDAGLLRYVYLIFQQTEFIICDEPHLNNTSKSGHDHFDTMAFAKKYGFGRPIATATFKSQWDDYVWIPFDQLHIAEENYKHL